MAIEKNLKQKTITSMAWNAVQRFGTMLLSFVCNLVLARLLMPEDFGCIGMLTIFIALSEAFIDGGFGAAIIQKKDTTQKDYSTIFYWNLVISFLFFIIMIVASPLVAQFYHMPILSSVLRVMSFVLLINGFIVIQTTILTKKLEFKTLAKINLTGTSAGVFVSIIAAFYGMGVWSLVLKTLIASIISGILLWKINKWRPSLEFSWSSFKSLFNFGGLMLLSSLLNTLFENIQGLVIGRVYTATDMGYYSQAKRLDEIPSRSVTQIVTQVSFPVFAKISDNLDSLKNAVKKNIICINFLIFPLQILLIVLSEPLIRLLFSDKWIDSVPYFRILCVYSMFVALNALNTNIYKAVGKSNVYFWVQLSKKVLGIILLLLGLRYGIMGVAWSVSISGFLWWIISAIVNKKIVNYGLFEQIIDILPSVFISIIVGVIFFVIELYLKASPIISIMFIGLGYITIYLLISRISNPVPYRTFHKIVMGWGKSIQSKINLP